MIVYPACPDSRNEFGFRPVTSAISRSRFLHPFPVSLTNQHPLFFCSLFSWSYEFLFPQPLLFDNHPNCPRGVGYPAAQNVAPFHGFRRNSLRCHTYEKCACNPFPCHTYKIALLQVLSLPHIRKNRGVSGIMVNRPVLVAVATSGTPLSLPLPQYPAPIAPSISPRHHFQDAPNRVFGRCPSLSGQVETAMATINRQELERLERRERRRFRLRAGQRPGRLHVSARLCPP